MATVTLSSCRPDTDSVTLGQGGVIGFKSGDGHTYFIDFGSGEGTLSNGFLLEVPSNGSTVTLHIKATTPVGTFMYAIQNAQKQQCWPVADSAPGDVPPKIIVE